MRSENFIFADFIFSSSDGDPLPSAQILGIAQLHNIISSLFKKEKNKTHNHKHHFIFQLM